MGKKYIKGFSGLRVWPVTTNNETTYATEEMTAIPGVQTATVDRATEDYTINADDGIWDSGADFTSETMEITVIELPLELMAQLDGAHYDEEDGMYSWGPNKVAPELALGFRALKADGTYRMIQYYSGTVSSIKTEYTTKGNNKEGSAYVITMSMKPRTVDGQLHIIKDGTVVGDSVWLDTIDNVPDIGA